MNYIVIEIGCLECGLGHTLIGRFETEAEADDLVDTIQKQQQAKGYTGGDVAYIVFNLTEIGEPAYV